MKNRRYFIAFLLCVPLIAYSLFLIPVQAITGNDIKIQLSRFGLSDYLLLFLLAILESLLITMLVYSFRRPGHAQKHRFAVFGHGELGVISGVVSFLFGSKLCPICITLIFGIFGPGVVVFALEYRRWIFLASVIVLFFSVYSIAKKINGVCDKCKIL